MPGKDNTNTELGNALVALHDECEAYLTYLERQIDNRELSDKDPLLVKRDAIELLMKILDDQTFEDNANKAQALFETYNTVKPVFIRTPDEYAMRFFKAVAYVFASLATGFLFNLGRMAYRHIEGQYVGFSAGFNSEKFVKNANKKISEVICEAKPHKQVDADLNFPTGPFNWEAKKAAVTTSDNPLSPGSRKEAIQYWKQHTSPVIPRSAPIKIPGK